MVATAKYIVWTASVTFLAWYRLNLCYIWLTKLIIQYRFKNTRLYVTTFSKSIWRASTTYLNRNFDVLFLIRIIFFIDICKSNTKLFNSNCFYETFIKLNLTTKVLQTYIKIVYLQIESYTKDHGIKPLRLYFNKTNLSVPLAQLFPTQL